MPATRACGKGWVFEPVSSGCIMTTFRLSVGVRVGKVLPRYGAKFLCTFLPAYRPLVMMATRPTLRTMTYQLGSNDLLLFAHSHFMSARLRRGLQWWTRFLNVLCACWALSGGPENPGLRRVASWHLLFTFSAASVCDNTIDPSSLAPNQSPYKPACWLFRCMKWEYLGLKTVTSL